MERLSRVVALAYCSKAMRERGMLGPASDGVKGFLRQHQDSGANPGLCDDRFMPFELAHNGVTDSARSAGGPASFRPHLRRSLIIAAG